MGYRDSGTILSLVDLVRTFDNKDTIVINNIEEVKDFNELQYLGEFYRWKCERDEIKNSNTFIVNSNKQMYNEIVRLLSFTNSSSH